MDNRDIRLEWVPSQYRENTGDTNKTDAKAPAIKTTRYIIKGIYNKQGFKRKYLK